MTGQYLALLSAAFVIILSQEHPPRVRGVLLWAILFLLAVWLIYHREQAAEHGKRIVNALAMREEGE